MYYSDPIVQRNQYLLRQRRNKTNTQTMSNTTTGALVLTFATIVNTVAIYLTFA